MQICQQGLRSFITISTLMQNKVFWKASRLTSLTPSFSTMSATRTTRSITKRLNVNATTQAGPAINDNVKDGRTKRKELQESTASPATPPAKKQRKTLITPSPRKTVSLQTERTVQESNVLKDRPAEPHMTNAPLLTPHGSRLITYTNATADISPSKSGIPKATTTTGQLLEEGIAHLIRVDPKLKPLIEKHHCTVFDAAGLAEDVEPFQSLVSGILSQQVSGAAARSIKKKFIGLFDGRTEGEESDWSFPLPSAVAESPIPLLRTAGLSGRKAEYVQGLAAKFASGELTAKWLMEAPYDEMVEKLVAVRGLGKWSVEMFACFALKRMDIFSLGDLGVQRGVGVALGRDIKKCKAKGGKWKFATEKEMMDYAEPFAPYRSLLMWYMWKLSDTEVEAVEKNR